MTDKEGNPAGASEKFVRMFAPDIVELPPPGKHWLLRNQDMDATTWRRFRAEGVIRVAERRVSNRTHVWETDPNSYELAHDIIDRRDALPCCGATGIVNDAGTIRCNRCGQAHDRETAMEVLA